MLIPIYYGKRHTFAVVADRCAELVCPHCNKGFRMIDRVGAVGEGFSILGLQDAKAADAAYQKAIKNLGASARQLSPVPCPGCGGFHPDMKPILSWLLGQKILFAFMAIAVVLAIGAMVIYMKTGLQEKATVGGMGVAALLFLAFRYWKDLRLCPVSIESMNASSSTPASKIGLRFKPEQDWVWL